MHARIWDIMQDCIKDLAMEFFGVNVEVKKYRRLAPQYYISRFRENISYASGPNNGSPPHSTL